MSVKSSLAPSDKELVLKVIPMPADCNANGDIFGGWVMAQVDLAGSVIPARYVQGRMATVAVREFVFKQPVRVGDRLGTDQVWRSVSDEKKTKLGRGRFWVIDVEYENQKGEKVATESYTGLGYRRA